MNTHIYIHNVFNIINEFQMRTNTVSKLNVARIPWEYRSKLKRFDRIILSDQRMFGVNALNLKSEYIFHIYFHSALLISFFMLSGVTL